MSQTLLLPTRSTSPYDDETRSLVARTAAIVALVALGLQLQLGQGITVGLIVAVALTPVWFPALASYRWARLLVLGGVATIVGGIVLGRIGATERQVSLSQVSWNVAELATIIVGIGVVLWARRILPDAHVTQWFGAGMILGVLPQVEAYSLGVWKFGFSVPAAVLLLALAQRTGIRWLQLAVLGVLAVAAIASDARSEFATLLVAGLVVAWQLRPRFTTRRGSAAVLLAGGLGAVVVVYNIGQALILDGLFGAETQQRTQQQLETGGSLLLGGRPELAATWALMQANPLGYGAGVVPSLTDVRIAKEGMAAINYDPNNGYVERFMFGGNIELHSIFGDLWAWFGIPGLLLTALLLVLLLRGVGNQVVSNAASGLLVYLTAKSLWNLFFSPVLTSIPALILAVGLALLTHRHAEHPR